MTPVKVGIDRILRDSGIDPRRAVVESAGFDSDGNLALEVGQRD